MDIVERLRDRQILIYRGPEDYLILIFVGWEFFRSNCDTSLEPS